MIKSFIFCGLLILAFGFCTRAQDSSKRKTINITSSFKPVLRDAVKINFNAAPPIADTSRPRLQYAIPSQYLFLSYQPSELRPVALQTDSILNIRNDNYIKLGIGNVHQPYLKAGFTFGDPSKSYLNIFAEGYTSKGSLPFQKNSLFDVAVSGAIKTKSNLEWDGKLGFKNEDYYLYGFRPDTLKYVKEQLLQRFQRFDGSLALRNIIPTEFGLSYNPNINVSVFTDSHTPQATEENTVLNLPLEKTIGKKFVFKLGFTANLTNYRVGSSQTIQNNLYFVSPALSYKSDNLNIKAELTPSWDQSIFHLLPNFMADVTTNDQKFTLQFGWIGFYNKGSYERFETINPWLAQPNTLLNTRVQEGYAGFKGSINNHFSYAAKVGLVQYWNMPLFVNDSLDGKTFLIRYEPNLKSLEMHGEITYTQGEQFTATAALTINQYDPKQETEAWGLMPLEFTTTLRWQILKDLWIKGDLLAFNGAPYLGKDNNPHNGQGAFDLNAGVEFRITRQLNLWLQMNNIFNNQYERWHQYKVYGFNILGGIIFSFGE
jgi:hypothetical protein